MCEPVVPPTPEGKQHKTKLMIIGFIHMCLAILLCFIMVETGLFELINVAILFCALAQMNYCCLIIYVINISINFFILFNQIGLLVQTGAATEILKDSQLGTSFALTVLIILLIFYVIASIFCFYAYREFKGMLFDAGAGGGFGMGHMMQDGGRDGSRSSSEAQDNRGGRQQQYQ